MNTPNENIFAEFRTQIEYYSSKFELIVKEEKNSSFKIILIYEKEIEYSSLFSFIDFQKNYPIFETLNHFFKFLKESLNVSVFFISELNREYCYLALCTPDNTLIEDYFKLLNIDKDKDVESYKEKKLLNCSVDELIDMCKKSDNVILSDITFENGENCFIFNLKEHCYIIFTIKIRVIFNIDNEKNIEDDIRTNYDIYELIKKYKIDEKDVFCQQEKLEEVIKSTDTFIKNNKLELRVIKKQIPVSIFGQNVLKSGNNSRIKYSQYFIEYFENYDPKNKDKIFKYKKSELRDIIFANIKKLYRRNNIKKYKITGPFSTGKSITLFQYSRLNPNAIYINLKALKKNKNDYKKCLDIIFSECIRVELNKDLFNERIKFLKVEDNILAQLLYIIEIILNTTDNRIILILDQFKTKNIEYEPRFMEKIEELLKINNFRVVFCSSINDKNIREEVIKTWRIYKGNPPELNSKTQEYYFYYCKLFFHEESKFLSYKLFHNKYKYIKKAKKYKNLDTIYNKIIDKLKDFHSYHSDKMLSHDIYNLNDIFIFLKSNINIKIPKYSFLEVVSLVSLEYFIIEINEDYFLLEPAFPFINYCISRYINMKEWDDCFDDQKYLNISLLSNKIKEENFEYSAIKALQDSEIIKFPLNYNNIEEVTVNEIVK